VPIIKLAHITPILTDGGLLLKSTKQILEMNLSKEDLQIINEVFCQSNAFDLPEKWDEEFNSEEDADFRNENFTSARFSEVWDRISSSL